MDTIGQPSSSQKPALKQSLPFVTCMEAWNIYLSIQLCSNPERALELIGYQHLICSVNKLLALNAWVQYYSKFHTIAASNMHLRWDQQQPHHLQQLNFIVAHKSTLHSCTPINMDHLICLFQINSLCYNC